MDFEDCWERVRLATDLKKQNQLAEFLNINASNVSAAKTRDSFPADWALKISAHYSLNTDWIMTGKGSQKSRDRVKEEVEELEFETPGVVDFEGVLFEEAAADAEDFRRTIKYILREGSEADLDRIHGVVYRLANNIRARKKRREGDEKNGQS